MGNGLESANLKIVRAQEHLDALESSIKRYISTNPGIAADANGNPTLHLREQPPDCIAVITGEVVYQLRSVLDHLAFDLVKRNFANVQLPVKWEENCLFPLKLQLPNNVSAPPVPYGHPGFKRNLPGISEAAFAFIESVQPYYRRGTANALRLLAQLCNVDKHRHFNVTVPKTAQFDTVVLSDGRKHSYFRSGLKHGTALDKLARGDDIEDDIVDSETRLTSYVTFDEPTVGDGAATLEVQNVLEVILQQVKSVVVPKFAEFLGNP
jgi:hypothetical protein